MGADALSWRAASDERIGREADGGTIVRLVPGLVHEARNPLNALAIHLEVLGDKLRDEATGLVPSHLARNLEAARAQLRRLDGLLRRFSDFAAGTCAPEEPAACLERARGLVEYQLRRAGVSATVDAAPSTGVGLGPAACVLLVELLLLATERAAPSTTLALRAAAAVDTIDVEVAGSGEEPGDAAGGALERLASRTMNLGGTIAVEEGAQWRIRLRLPAVELESRV